MPVRQGKCKYSRPYTATIAVMDDVDREILSLLVRDGRTSFRDLGAAVGLSANAAAERVRRLRERGVITGFTATVDPAATDRRLTVIIEVRLAQGVTAEHFTRAISRMADVIEAVHVTGQADYELRAACRDTATLNALLAELKRSAGAVSTDTKLVLATVLQRQAGATP